MLLNPIKLQGFSSCIVISNKNIMILLHHPNKAFILKTYTKGKQGKQVRISAYNKFSGKQICYSSHMAAFYDAKLQYWYKIRFEVNIFYLKICG